MGTYIGPVTSRLPRTSHPQGIDEWKTPSPLRKIEPNLIDRSKKTTKNLTPIGRVDPNGFAALLGTEVDEEDLADVSANDAPPTSSTPSARTALPAQRTLPARDKPSSACQGGAGEKTEPTSTRSGFRFGKFCSTKLLCVFLTVVVGLGCSAFALSSYGSGGVSELLSLLVPDAAAIPVSVLSSAAPASLVHVANASAHLEALRRCSIHGHLGLSNPMTSWSRPQCLRHLPEGWRFIHVFKAGGTSIQKAFGGIVPNCTWKYHSIFTTVRSPVSHFLSGYHEAMMRLKHDGYLPPRHTPYDKEHPMYRLATNHMDRLERVRETLAYLHQRPEPLHPRAYAEFHFEPAVHSLITGEHQIQPGLAIVVELPEVGELFNVNLPHKRSAVSEGFLEFRVQESELNGTELIQLCNFMIIDFCCLSYELPDLCARYYDSPESWALRAYAPNRSQLWACARDSKERMALARRAPLPVVNPVAPPPHAPPASTRATGTSITVSGD